MFYTGLIQGKCPINVNWYCYNPHNIVILLSKWGNCATVFVRNQVASCQLLGSKFEWESLGKGWRDGSFLMCVKKDTVRGYWNCMSQYVL